MTRLARAENQPGAARCQPRATPPDEESRDTEVQAQPKTRAGLRAQKQPGAENYNPFGRIRPREEQPQAWCSNFYGNLWIPIPCLYGLYTAYETCGEMLESIINSTTPSIPFTILSELTSLNTLVKEKQKLLAEHKDNLFIGRWMYDSKQTQVVDADTAKFVRKQDDRIRSLCTDVLEKLVTDPLIAQEEYEAGTSHTAHVRNVLEDVYEKCNLVLLEQIREYEQAITEKEGTSVGGKRDKLKAFFVNITSKGVSQPVVNNAKATYGNLGEEEFKAFLK